MGREVDEDAHCAYCEIYLNGQGQWEEHLRSKKHKKKVQDRCMRLRDEGRRFAGAQTRAEEVSDAKAMNDAKNEKL